MSSRRYAAKLGKRRHGFLICLNVKKSSTRTFATSALNIRQGSCRMRTTKIFEPHWKPKQRQSSARWNASHTPERLKDDMSKLKSLLVALFLVASASASTLTGTVQNMTSGKTAAGDEVALIGLSQGMSVLAQTKTDASGKFSFNFDDANTPHL